MNNIGLLHECIGRMESLSSEYIANIGKPVNSSSEYYKIIVNDIPNCLRELIKELGFDVNNYKVKGSCGMGAQKIIPWAAILDKRITTTVQKGVLLGLSWSYDFRHAEITINQGYNEFKEKFKADRVVLQEMRKRRDEIRKKIYIQDARLDTDSSEHFSKYSKAAVICFYILQKDPKDAVMLLRFLHAYDEYAKQIEVENKLINYWWLHANPKIWSFSRTTIGEPLDWSTINSDGNKRRVYKYFLDANPGDLVIGYESTPVNSVVALLKVLKEHDNDTVLFEKTHDLITPINKDKLLSIPCLQGIEFFKNPQGSFFKLTEDEYKMILRIIYGDSNTIKEENIEEDFHIADKTEEETIDQYTKDDFLSEVFLSEQEYDDMAYLLVNKKNIILQGAPGVGKTFIAKRLAYSIMNEIDDSRIEMIQFHQNYTYEDFIMGYRPKGNGSFELREGVFYSFCKKAINEPDKDFFFILDEINRGNLSKIFGEILMLIESDKRGQKFSIPLTYQPNCRFFIPSNLFIIGTMNTADRSLAMIDYALRRRFCFVDIQPAFCNERLQRFLLSQGLSAETVDMIQTKMTYINNQIAIDCNLGKGYRIGHSYFCNPPLDEHWFQSIIKYEIVPLLEEYWFDNIEKANECREYLLR